MLGRHTTVTSRKGESSPFSCAASALVVDLIHRHVTNGSLDLIETLAVNIAEGILAMFELVGCGGDYRVEAAGTG